MCVVFYSFGCFVVCFVIGRHTRYVPRALNSGAMTGNSIRALCALSLWFCLGFAGCAGLVRSWGTHLLIFFCCVSGLLLVPMVCVCVLPVDEDTPIISGVFCECWMCGCVLVFVIVLFSALDSFVAFLCVLGCLSGCVMCSRVEGVGQDTQVTVIVFYECWMCGFDFGLGLFVVAVRCQLCCVVSCVFWCLWLSDWVAC